MTDSRLKFVLPAAAFLIIAQVAPAVAQDGDPADAIAIFDQGQTAHEKGDLGGAIELYKKALKIIPDFPEADYQCGAAYLAQGDEVNAEIYFREAIIHRADWTLALTSLGSLLVQTGKFEEADKLLSHAIEIDAQNSSAYSAMAELRLKTNAPADVLAALLQKIIPLTTTANPTATVWTARSAIEDALGKKDDAKKSLANALAIDPKNKYALSQTAKISIADGDLIRAEAAITELERISPQAASTKTLRVRLLAAEGKPEDALKVLDSIAPPTAEADEIRSQLTAAQSVDAAEIEKRLAVDPKNATLLSRLCVLDRVKAPAKALDYCRQAAEAEPNNIDHAIGYGAALVQARQFEQAVGLFQRLLPIGPDNRTVHANLATALFELKRYAEAKEQYQWLVEREPDLAVAYYFLGIANDQLAEYLDAMANYQQFLRLADPAKNQLEIDKVNLRLPALQRQIKGSRGKKST